MSFVFYCDFETTAPTGSQSPEGTVIFAVSYIIVFAFHPDLNFERIIVERSFGHNLSKLTYVAYLNCKMLQYPDPVTTVQLRDCGIKVTKRNIKQAMSEMFGTELRFAGDCIRK